MFFSDDFLLRKKGGMGIIWLSATLGTNRSSTTISSLLSSAGLTKKQIMGVDVARACQNIMEPAEPLALRASAGLMVGVVRLFGARYQIFTDDVTSLETATRRAMLDLNMAQKTGPNLELAQGGAARKEAINLPKTVDGFALGNDMLNQAVDWETFMQKFNKIGEEEEENTWNEYESQMVSQSQNIRTGTPIPGASPHSELLPAHCRRYGSLGYSDRLASPQYDGEGREGIRGRALGPGRDQAEGVPREPEQQVDLGLDLNFEDDWMVGGERMSKKKHQQSRRGSESGGDLGNGGFAGFGFSFDAGGMDFVMDDAAFGGEDYLDLENLDPGLERPSEQARRDIECGKEAMRQRLGSGLDDGYFEETNHRFQSAAKKRPIENIAEALTGEGVEGQNKRKKLKKRMRLFDRITELEDEELRASRQGYAMLMAEAQAQNKVKETAKSLQNQIESIFKVGFPLGLPEFAISPELLIFFKETVVDKFDGIAKPVRAQESYDDEEIEGVKRIRDGDGMDFDLEGGFDFEAVQFGDQDVELGRRGSVAPRDQVMPWENFGGVPPTSDLGDDAFGIGPLSYTGTGGAKFSLDTPQQAGLRLARGRSSSILGSGKSGPVHLGILDDLLDDGGLKLPDESSLQLELETNESIKDSQGMSAAELNKAGADFLKYVNQKAGDDPFAASKTVYFTQLAPVETSSAKVAATAFYLCLTLATRKHIDLTQEVACGAITVSVK